MKQYKRSILVALLLLVYASLIITFLTIPAFEETFLDRKSEVGIITIVPLLAVILAIRTLVSKKKAEQETLLRSLSEQVFLTQFFIIYFIAIFILAPLALFTEKMKEIQMCDSIWHPAWMISLAIAIFVTVRLFIYGKRKTYFIGQLIFMCVITLPMAYFFPIILFKLLAFGVNCMD